MPTTILHTTSVEMPDGTLLEVNLSLSVEYQENPEDLEPEHDDGSDDGWIVTDVSLAD